MAELKVGDRVMNRVGWTGEVKYLADRKSEGRRMLVIRLDDDVDSLSAGDDVWGAADYWTKVEPFFEAGKTYVDSDGERFEAVHISERNGLKAAFGWGYYLGDEVYADAKTLLGRWIEVTD
jgi:hypothetical protein